MSDWFVQQRMLAVDVVAGELLLLSMPVIFLETSPRILPITIVIINKLSDNKKRPFWRGPA